MLVRYLVLGGSLALAMLFGDMHAEVARVTLRWTPQLCQGNCTRDLLKYLNPIAGNAETDVDIQAGQARLRWKPLSKFSFDAVNAAMRMVGLRVNEVRVRVRGTVIASGNNVTLVSIGDNTAFTLMGAVQPRNSNEAVVQFNTASHPLSQDMLQQLVNAQATFQIVEVEGPLFMPTRSIAYGGNNLIVEQLTFPNPPFKQGPQKAQR